MKPIQWDMCSRRGYNVEEARIGMFTATLVCSGAGTIGMNVWIGLFNGEMCAISATREKAIEAIKAEAMRMLVEAGAAIGATERRATGPEGGIR
jgi:hypothetical protein